MVKDRQESPAKRTVKESGPHLSKWSPRESEDAQLAKTVLNFKVGPADRSDQLPFKSTHSTMDKDRQESPGKSVTAKENGPHQSKWSPRESEDAQLAKAFLADLSDQLPTKPIQKFVPETYVPSVQSMQHYCVLKNVHNKTNYINSVIQLLHHNHTLRHYVHENASYGPMHTALVELFEQMDLMIYASADDILGRLLKYKPQLNVQHEAQQLCLALVEVMYQETSKDTRSVTALEHKTADQARKFVNTNRLASLMMSLVETSVLCLECCQRSASWSIVPKVQVDFPCRATLQSSFDNLFKEQTVLTYCPFCAKVQESGKRLSICRPPPPLLLVHIPRLQASTRPVDQSMVINDSLNLNQRHKYALSSAVMMQKTNNMTKYWTLVRKSDQKWIELRDDVDGIIRERADALMQLDLYSYLLLFNEVKVEPSATVKYKYTIDIPLDLGADYEEEIGLGSWISAKDKDNTNKNDLVANTYDEPFDGKPFGYCGLRNLNLTCYANSCIQLLFTLNKVRHYIVDHAKQGHFHQALGALFTSMQTEANKPKTFDLYASPADFMNKFRVAKPQFRANQMADAQEYLTILLETIHQEANVATKLSHTERPKVEPKSAEESWNYHVQHVDQSYLSELFMGQIECSLLCCACEHKSLSWSCIWQLQVQIPNTQAQPNQDQTQQNEFTLLDCIKEYITTETLNMDSAPFCSECQSRQSATKGTTFSRVPHYLMVHLKRFTADGIKIHVPVVINEHLNLAGQDYVLLSVVLHAGSESFGHNWAMHREGDNQWVKLDDRSVSKGLSNDYAKMELKDDAYVCVYEKVTPTETSAKDTLATKV